MELVECFLDGLESKHPKLIWFLVRFMVSVGVITMFMFGAMIVCLTMCPIIMLISGKSIACFLIWFLLPVPLFITWVSSDITKYVYSEYINTDTYCGRY